MKCPKCQKVYSNELSFCLDDGSTLFSDANLSGLGKQMSAETIVINQPTKPIQKNSNKWIFVSISIAAVIIFMTAGVILAWQTINYVKQSNANKPKVILDIDKNGNTQNPNGLDKNDSDETLNLEDAKTLDKLKSEGLLIAQKTPNKPNPLILMVEINSENGDLELNKENVGNILAKNNLGERLSQEIGRAVV